MRAILHIYIPSFFAEAERKRRPQLAVKPVIVARAKGNTSGIVMSASQEAMKAGVTEGMSVRQAKRSCPEAVFLSADNDFYRQLFDKFLDILAHCSPLLEPDLPDGAYLDVTASRKLFGDPVKISRRIAAQVIKRLGLPVFIGCASNKLVARIASRSRVYASESFLSRRIEDCIAQVSIGLEAKVISQFPVTVLDSVTEKTAKQLGDLGVTTVGQLAMIPEGLLVRRFGPVGSVMKKQSLGIDMSPVRAAYPPETIITERMFDCPLEEPAQIEKYLAQMTIEALAKLRKKGALAGEVVLTLFDELSHPNPLPQKKQVVASYFRFKKPTDSAATLQQSLAKMLYEKMQPGMEICRVQVVLSDLTHGESSQLCLIGEVGCRSQISRVVDVVRKRFGESSIFFASSLAMKGRARVLGRIAA